MVGYSPWGSQRVRHDWEPELAILALLLDSTDNRAVLTAVMNARHCALCAPTSARIVLRSWVLLSSLSGEKCLQRGGWERKACWRSQICKLYEEEEGIPWVNGVCRDLTLRFRSCDQRKRVQTSTWMNVKFGVMGHGASGGSGVRSSGGWSGSERWTLSYKHLRRCLDDNDQIEGCMQPSNESMV